MDELRAGSLSGGGGRLLLSDRGLHSLAPQPVLAAEHLAQGMAELLAESLSATFRGLLRAERRLSCDHGGRVCAASRLAP